MKEPTNPDQGIEVLERGRALSGVKRNILVIGLIMGSLTGFIFYGVPRARAAQQNPAPHNGPAGPPPAIFSGWQAFARSLTRWGQSAGILPQVPASAWAPLDSDLTLDGEERQLIELYEQVSPSVVHLRTDRPRLQIGNAELGRRAGERLDRAVFRGRISDPNGGSGFVLDEHHILTTNRVVEDARWIEVFFADGTRAMARVVGADRNTDLAVLRVDRMPATARPLPLGDSDLIQVGQRVLALGNPLGYEVAMTAGIVSGKARSVRLEIRAGGGFFTAPDLVQTDAAIIPGSVGGPLVNLDGEVIGVLGVDTLYFDAAGDFPAGGIGFSIPASTVERVVPVLLREGRYAYPWLGISGVDLEPDITRVMGLPLYQRGVLVVQVSRGGPSEKAGLRPGDQVVPELGPTLLVGGDVIIAFDGHPIRDFRELVSVLFRVGNVGDTITLTVIRDGAEQQVPVVLEERP